jgi:thiol-disulfide isomerase/thioredoxin
MGVIWIWITKMQRIKGLLTVALTTAVVLTGAVKIVDLVLTDRDSRRVRLSDYRGKSVVLNFWATWCGPCRAEMPLLTEAEREYGSRGVAFIAASLDEAKARNAIREFVEKFQIGFPVWYGATGDDLDKFQLGNAVPATAFLDPEGRVAARVLGQMRKEELIERLEWLTSDRKSLSPKPLIKRLAEPVPGGAAPPPLRPEGEEHQATLMADEQSRRNARR